MTKKSPEWKTEPYSSLLEAVRNHRPGDVSKILQEDNARETPLINLGIPIEYTEEGICDTLIVKAIRDWGSKCVKEIVESRRTDSYDNAGYSYALNHYYHKKNPAMVSLLLAQGASIYDRRVHESLLQLAVNDDDGETTAQIFSYMPHFLISRIFVRAVNSAAVRMNPLERAIFHKKWASANAILSTTNPGTNAAYQKSYDDALRLMCANPDCFNLQVALRLMKGLKGKAQDHFFMHDALGQLNTNMVAVLQSYHVDLMQEEKGGATPLEDVTRFKTEIDSRKTLDCLVRAKTIHAVLDYAMKGSTTRNLLTLFVRAKNNKSSFFQRLPNAILEKSILPFVTTEVCEHQQTIAARAAYLPKLYSWYRQNRELQEETKRMPNLLCRARDYLAGSQQSNDLLAQGLDRIFPPVPCSTDEAQQNPDASKKLK